MATPVAISINELETSYLEKHISSNEEIWKKRKKQFVCHFKFSIFKRREKFKLVEFVYSILTIKYVSLIADLSK